VSKPQVPTDGRKFAILVGAKPTPVGWYARRRFLEKIGVREKPASGGSVPTDGKAFAESIRGRK
jgi:hypothetical protein